MVPRTSSRIWIKSLLSSGKDWGLGSRPLSVRNFNKTVKMKREKKRRLVRRQERITFTMNYYFMERPNLNDLTAVARPIKKWITTRLHHQWLNTPEPTLPPIKTKAPISKKASSDSICTTRAHHQHLAPTFPLRVNSNHKRNSQQPTTLSTAVMHANAAVMSRFNTAALPFISADSEASSRLVQLATIL